MSYSFNGADYCGEGTGHFRSSGAQKWKSNWNEQKQLHGVIAPIATPSDYLDIVVDELVDDVVSLRGSLKNALPRSPRKSFNLVEFSPGV